MSVIILAAKALVVLLFLVIFLRTSKFYWGVGLLTVTSAILLDTFLGTFGRQQMIEELGFFFYIVVGVLIGGAVVWTWGLLRDISIERTSARRQSSDEPVGVQQEAVVIEKATPNAEEEPLAERLRAKMKSSFNQDDYLDLLYDMDWQIGPESAGILKHDELADRIIKLAESRNQLEQLDLGIERVLSPLTPDQLPRSEKITAESPKTVLRQFILANCSNQQLTQMASTIEFHWQDSTVLSKSAKVRELLVFAGQNNQLEAFINDLKSDI